MKLDKMFSLENFYIFSAVSVAVILFLFLAFFIILWIGHSLGIKINEDIKILDLGVSAIFFVMIFISILFVLGLNEINEKMKKISQPDYISEIYFTIIIILSSGFILFILIEFLFKRPIISDYKINNLYQFLVIFSSYTILPLFVLLSIFLMKARLNKIEEHIINNETNRKVYKL